MILVAFFSTARPPRVTRQDWVRSAQLLALLLAVASPALAQPRPANEQVTDLAKWARDNIADGRREQLALRFDPLVAAWQKADRVVEAQALLEVWIELDPSSSLAWKLLAAAQLEAQDFVAARSSSSRAVALVDDSAAHLGVALAAWELGDVEGAAASFEAALAREPSSQVRFQWARFLLWRGRGVRAYREFSQLPPGLQQRPEVAFLLAKACGAALPGEAQATGDLGHERETGFCDRETAVVLFERAAVLQPEHAEVRYGLARAYLRIGKREAARRQMELYRELAKRDQEEGRA